MNRIVFLFVSFFSVLSLSISVSKAEELLPGTKAITLYEDELVKLGITVNKGNLEYIESRSNPETGKLKSKKVIVKKDMFDFKNARKTKEQVKVSPRLAVIKYNENSAAYFSSLMYYNRDTSSPAEKAKMNAEINNLIAVNYHNPKLNNDITLWYEPTPEFIEVLPDRFKEDVKKDAAITTDTVNTYKSYNTSDLFTELMIYPNPATTGGNATLSFKLSDSRNFKIDLYDMGGRLIKNIQVGAYSPLGTYTTQFDLTDIHAGMYIVVIVTDRGEKAVQRIIVI